MAISPKNKWLLWAVVAVVATAGTVLLMRFFEKSETVPPSDQSHRNVSADAIESTGIDDIAGAKRSPGKRAEIRTMAGDSDATLSLAKKKERRPILDVSPENMSEISPVAPGLQTAEERQRARARGTRARVLNERVAQHLAALKAKRNDATGDERRRLDDAINILERNVRWRGQLESASELPQRISMESQ